MKALRISVLIVVSLSLVLASGYLSKRHVYNFVNEGDLERYDGDWYAYSGSYDFDDGLILDGIYVAAPFFFTGDFTGQLNFNLDAEESDSGMIEYYYGTQQSWPGSDWLGGIVINNIGDPSVYYRTYYRDNDTLYFVEEEIPCEGIINNPGSNTIKIFKKGDSLEFELNGTAIGAPYAIIGNTSGLYCPHIYGWSSDETSIIFTYFEVKYEGDMIPVV